VVHEPERELRIDPRDARPIWRQIEQGVADLVAAGRFPPDAPVPSVRDLARSLRVNPATVAKAYTRLVDGGILVVRRGAGTFVAERPPTVPRAEKHKRLKEAARRFAVATLAVGADPDESLREARLALARLPPPQGDSR